MFCLCYAHDHFLNHLFNRAKKNQSAFASILAKTIFENVSGVVSLLVKI